ncbi:MAG: sugar phosphate nucleotidyltransferase [Archaeoglobaceae archaeon]
MKAVIMAGGYATRLWPITKTKSKPLLPIGREKIIDHVYDKIAKFNIPIIVSTNMRFENDFKDWAATKDSEVDILVEETHNQEEKLGAVRALNEVVKTLNDEVLVVAGDNLFSFQLEGLMGYYREINKDRSEDDKIAVTVLYDVGKKELARRYGVAELEGDKVVGFQEKPEDPKSTLVGIGIYIFPQKTVSMLRNYVDKTIKSDNLGDFVSWLCQNTEVNGYSFSEGNWYDVGNPDSYLDAFKIFMEESISDEAKIEPQVKIISPVTIDSGTEITGRSIIGPFACIGRDCIIDNSDVSDTVVFNKVVLRKVKVWRGILDEECEIRNLELNRSIIGEHAKIQRG